MTSYWNKRHTITKTRHVAESCNTVHQTFQPYLTFTVLIRIIMNLHNSHSNMKMWFTCLFTCIFINKQRFMWVSADFHSRTSAKSLWTTSRNLEMDPWGVYDSWGNLIRQFCQYDDLRVSCRPWGFAWSWLLELARRTNHCVDCKAYKGHWPPSFYPQKLASLFFQQKCIQPISCVVP